MAKFGSVLQEARKSYLDNVLVPKIYISALQMSQLFEFQLELLVKLFIYKYKLELKNNNLELNIKTKISWTNSDYIKLLKTFYNESDNREFYNSLAIANQDRNKFIHESFRDRRGGINIVNLDQNVHLSKNARSKANNCIESIAKANSEISKIIEQNFKGIKFKFSDLSKY